MRIHLQHFAFICICMHSFAFICINLHWTFPFRIRDKSWDPWHLSKSLWGWRLKIPYQPTIFQNPVLVLANLLKSSARTGILPKSGARAGTFLNPVETLLVFFPSNVLNWSRRSKFRQNIFQIQFRISRKSFRLNFLPNPIHLVFFPSNELV